MGLILIGVEAKTKAGKPPRQLLKEIADRGRALVLPKQAAVLELRADQNSALELLADFFFQEKKSGGGLRGQTVPLGLGSGTF